LSLRGLVVSVVLVPTSPTKDATTFGVQLKQLMDARGLNQSTLAKKSGVERSVINRIISGKARPRLEQLDWIARVLAVDVHELMLIADLPSEVRDLFEQLCSARERIRELERERDEALARVPRIGPKLGRRVPPATADTS
jgi:transcriptional regulator with XRE-family HTH domain